MTGPIAISRQELIERYLEYDSQKKSIFKPETRDWDWNDPDKLDFELQRLHFKYGIISGFQQWRLEEFDQEALASCAVVISIAKSLNTDRRSLGEFRDLQGFPEWGTNRPTLWSKEIAEGKLSDLGIMIARPSVACEHPARFYFEDGSGRATAVYKRLVATNDTSTKIPVFIGELPDSSSSFMRNHFGSLLRT